MQNYSYNEFTKELLISTLRSIDWLDNAHPAIPKHSVIADVELPEITGKQAFIVVGERSKISFMKGDLEITINECFLVSKNLEIVEDHRGEDVYSTVDGSKVEIKELGELPENVTDQPKPEGYYKWNGENWVEDTEAKDEATKQQNNAFLSSETRRVNDAIAPLDDAIEFGMATEDEIYRHKELRKYRILLSRVPNQEGWPLEVTWPDKPEFFK